MNHKSYIERPASTPTPHPKGYAYGLPAEMLQQASRRLSILAIVYAGTYFAAFMAGRFTAGPHDHQSVIGPLGGPDLIAITFITISLVLAWFVRRKSIDPQRLLDLGLIFAVFGAVGIDISILLYPIPESLTGISWTCVWIVMFPIIVPGTPGKVFLAAFAAASVAPLMYLIAKARGTTTVGLDTVGYLIIANYICVAIAVISSRVVYQLRTEVSKARRMGSYHLVELLGSGGMGEVWRAEHRLLARPAAVKLIRPEALGARDEAGKRELTTRFRREAQATAALSSPHTVQLYDYGVTEDGALYYVMELLRGLDLNTMIEKFGPLSPKRTVYILRQICDSLSEAHGSGLIHRDIKPANVYLCRLGNRFDFAKLLDFGLVKSTDTAVEGDTKLTMPNTTAGTPAFMAPEMVTGNHEITGQSDIYSLGCVAYLLLTGKMVFGGGKPMQVAFAHVNTPPDPLSTRTELEIPAGLEQAVLSCLEKEPSNRPRTAEDLSELLDAAAGESAWSQENAKDWWGAHLPDLAAHTSTTSLDTVGKGSTATS